MSRKSRDDMDGLMQAAADLYVKDPKVGRRRMVAALGCTGHMAEKLLAAVRSGRAMAARPCPFPKAADTIIGTPEGGKRPDGAKLGISVKEFGSRFDYESKLRGVLRELCRDRFVSDADIRERCDIPIPAFRTVAGLPEFQACQVKDRGTVYWSLKNNVDEVRQQARRWGISK